MLRLDAPRPAARVAVAVLAAGFPAGCCKTHLAAVAPHTAVIHVLEASVVASYC